MDDFSRPVTGYPASATGYPPYPAVQSNTNPNGYSSTTASAAYPSAAPQPHPTYYQPQQIPNYPTNPYAAQRATFLRRILAFVIASIIISCVIVFILWLVLRPRIPEFRVDSVTLSNFNLNTSLISGNWDVRFTVRNPNKKITLSYDAVEAVVFYKSASLSSTTLPPFVQGTKNETAIRATLAALSAYVDNWVVDGINRDRARGSVKFIVRMIARVRFKAGAWRARSRYVRVLCRDLAVGVSSNSRVGYLIGGSRECQVGL